MKTIDCHVCGAKRGAKRHIGIGTILLMILSFIVLVAGSIGFFFFHSDGGSFDGYFLGDNNCLLSGAVYCLWN